MKAAFLILSVCLSLAHGANQCEELSSDQKKFAPTLPYEFSVDIEVVQFENKKVQNMKMYYSDKLNIIRLDILDKLVKSSLYFLFTDNEILKFDFTSGRGLCDVIKMADGVDDFLFGGVQSQTNGSIIPVPLAAIHFMGKSGFLDHDIAQQYIGNKTVRGKNAAGYTSCQKWSSSNMIYVLNITQYFADKKYAFPYNDKASNLLAMEITGTGTSGNLESQIRHTYNYFNFRPLISLKQSEFETPDGIYCRNRVNTDKFPEFPNFIRFTVEIINQQRKMYYTMKEIYDYENKFALWKTRSHISTSKTINYVTVAYDFNSNVIYEVDETKNTCDRVDLLDVPSSVLSLYTVKGGIVTMNTPAEFFLSNPADFRYLGKKKIRGMDTDTWVAPSSKLKGDPDAVVQYNFAPSNVKSWNDETETKGSSWRIPVKFQYWKNKTVTKPNVENLFHVDFNKLRPEYVDFSNCFPYRLHLQLVMKGNRKQVVLSGLESFKWYAIKEITSIAKVGKTQLNQFKVYYVKDDIYIEFSLGGISTDIGKAANRIETAAKDKNLQLYVMNAKFKWERKLTIDNVATVNELNASIKKSSDDGYTAATMAGVGVAMVLVGLAGGAGAGFAHNKFFN